MFYYGIFVRRLLHHSRITPTKHTSTKLSDRNVPATAFHVYSGELDAWLPSTVDSCTHNQQICTGSKGYTWRLKWENPLVKSEHALEPKQKQIFAAAHLQLRKVEETAPAVLQDVARCCRMLHVMVCFGSTCLFTFVWLNAGQNATNKEIVFNPFLPVLLKFKFSQWANCAETTRAPKASRYSAASRHGCCGMGSKLSSGPGFLKLVHIVFNAFYILFYYLTCYFGGY